MLKIIKTQVSELNKQICNKILNDLPEWFGIPESLTEYCNLSCQRPFRIAYEEENPVGFISINALQSSLVKYMLWE